MHATEAAEDGPLSGGGPADILKNAMHLAITYFSYLPGLPLCVQQRKNNRHECTSSHGGTCRRNERSQGELQSPHQSLSLCFQHLRLRQSCDRSAKNSWPSRLRQERCSVFKESVARASTCSAVRPACTIYYLNAVATIRAGINNLELVPTGSWG